MKQCTKCLEFKPLTHFGNKSHTLADGTKTSYKRSHCRPCVNESNLKRFHTNFNTKEAHVRASYKHRIKSYGLTVEEYEKMFNDQQGKCAICETETTLVIDHCHKTGQVRKLLCNSCNSGLGHFRDSKELLAKAIGYLDD